MNRIQSCLWNLSRRNIRKLTNVYVHCFVFASCGFDTATFDLQSRGEQVKEEEHNFNTAGSLVLSSTNVPD